jgi:hypothetical protein
MLGDELYGEVLYGEDKEEQKVYTLPERYTDLTKYVPPFIADMGEMAALLNAQGYEVGRAHALMDSMFDQSVPHLASWDLDHWEQMLGITNNESVSDEVRQSVIIGKLAGADTFTPQKVIEIAKAITGDEVRVDETPAEYKFTVSFIGAYGIPNHILLFKKIIEALRPAHLDWDIQYHYVIWEELTKNWTDYEAYTWDGLRISQILTFVSWSSLSTAMPSWRSLKSESWNTTTKLKEAMG